MGKLKEIGENYGIADIEEKIKKYGKKDAFGIDVAYYPTINGFASIDAYESFINVLIKTIHKEMSDSAERLADMTMAFKFSSDEPLREMPFLHFVFNLIMWRPFIVSGIKVTEQDIFNPEFFRNNEYGGYIDRFADRYRDRFTMSEFSEILHDMQHNMNQMAVNVGPLFGNSISIYDMVKMARKNKEVAEIFNTHIDLDSFQIDEAEEFLRWQTKRLKDILLNEDDENNPLKPFIRAGTGVNDHQVQETMVHLGFKPTIEGDTIPRTTNSNLMGDGLKTPEAVFVDSKGGRKAAGTRSFWVETLSRKSA